MKKLLVLAVVAVAAMCSNAASMNWKVVTGVEGLNIYICKSVADFASEAAISGYLYGTEANTGTAASNGRKPNVWVGDAQTIGGIDAADEGMKNFYAVVVDASGKGYYAKQGSGEVYTTATEPVQGAIDLASEIAEGNYTPWKQDDPPGPGPDPIPEPTSALLMVLGMAGLALRRRQA